MNTYLNELFNLDGKVAVVTGAGGHLCSEMAKGLARVGCAVAILDLRLEKAEVVENNLRNEGLLSVPAANNILRLLPPLNITTEHADECINILKHTLEKLEVN